MSEQPKFTGLMTSATIGGEKIDIAAIESLIIKVEKLRESKILDFIKMPTTFDLPMTFEPPADDPKLFRFRSYFDFAPMIHERRMFLTSCVDGPCWCLPKPPSRFIEYDASDRVWMEPLGMGEWK